MSTGPASTALRERPASAGTHNGGVPARRAVIRWSWRMFRREWRQQLLVLGLIVVALAATVLGAAVAVNNPPPANAGFGTALDTATFPAGTQQLARQIAALQQHYGQLDVIENQTTAIPGSVTTYDLRAQNPNGPFGQPMISLLAGHYPATAGQVAVTGGLAATFNLKVGDLWRQGTTTRQVTGIVQNPQSLLDEFALVVPGQVKTPTVVTVLFDAPGASPSALGPNVQTRHSAAAGNPINPETIVLALVTVATYFAASRPARAITRIPLVAALSGRPAPPKQVHRSAIPGVVLLVVAAVLFAYTGKSNGNGGGGPLALVGGFVALIVAVILLAPFCLTLLARAGRRAPIAERLALRDLVRYRARSASALAAISLGALIAVLICVLTAQRYGNVLDYTGPNLASNQIIVYTPDGNPNGGGPNGPSTPATTSTPQSQAATARSIATALGAHAVTEVDQTSASLQHAAAGRSWSGPVFVATPQLLAAFGIKASDVNPAADI
ncbi:MAG TPA: hypothetical protein VHO07_23160, partial [Streptosporangiaceae bacterium]|nr:hypothetical protein [Streptosporangiaceae bacterium]